MISQAPRTVPKRRRAPVDKTLLLIVALLLMFGLLCLFSATYYTHKADSSHCDPVFCY